MRNDFGLQPGEDLARRPAGGQLGITIAELRARGGNPGELARFEKGLEGEVLVGALLDALPGDSWHVLHSVPLPGIGDVDHLVVGPPGVFVVNTKNHRGRKVVVESEVVRVDGAAFEHYGQARRQAAVVVATAQMSALRDIPAIPLVAIVTGSTTELVFQGAPSDVMVFGSAELAARLQALPSRLAPDEVDQLYRILRWSDAWLAQPVTTRALPQPGARLGARPGARPAPRPRLRPPATRRRAQPSRFVRVVMATVAAIVVIGLWNVLTTSPFRSPATSGAAVQDGTLPVAPAVSQPLFSESELARFIEASLVAGRSQIDAGHWQERDGVMDADLEAEVGELAALSPYVHVTSWTVSDGVVDVVYAVDGISLSSHRIRTQMAAGEAAREIAAATDGEAADGDIRSYLDARVLIDPDVRAKGDDPAVALVTSPDEAYGALHYGVATQLGYERAFRAIQAELKE
ncbi:nuclease-related domain-containing protein [Demequina subtropica]|uniref:nuclease-related domain-containing protein n=1 Tax=Demequina subtropica TaxID=1638989 RepID=UPI0007849468|nr:nuclease-related domain-containing protein [Demequina subtropica]